MGDLLPPALGVRDRGRRKSFFIFLSRALADVFEKNEKKIKTTSVYRLCIFWGGGGVGARGVDSILWIRYPIHFCMVLSMFWPSYIFFARHQHGTKTLAFPETHDMVGFDRCEGPMGPILV